MKDLENKMGRKITIKALKYNPHSKISKAHFAEYELEETPGMTLFIALNKIKDTLDPDLAFDFVCRAGICGSCGMMINGVPGLGAKELKAGFIQMKSLITQNLKNQSNLKLPMKFLR